MILNINLIEMIADNNPFITSVTLVGKVTRNNIGNEEINNDDMWLLANALKHNIQITELYLERLKITERGWHLLSEALMQNKHLQLLTIKDCLLYGENAKAIGNILEANSSLREVRLYGDIISDYEIGILAQALKGNRTLRCLDIRGNVIKDEGALALMNMLDHNRHLSGLKISPSHTICLGMWDDVSSICDKNLRTIEQLLRRNRGQEQKVPEEKYTSIRFSRS